MSRLRQVAVSLTIVCVCALILLSPNGLLSSLKTAEAQASSQLVPLVTDQTPMAVSNRFGAPVLSVLNQAHDYAFIGNGASALFLRRAGGSPERVFQMSDEVPGFPGSRADILLTARLNNSGVLVFGVDFFQANGLGQGIIFMYDGVSLTKVVSGADPAPGGGGANFERTISLLGFNDSGDVAFTAPLVRSGSGLPNQTTLYIMPGGGSPVRVIGLGDPAPGTAGAIGSITSIGLNNLGEVLFRSNINGGAGGSGLFVGTTSGVRKVVAFGDVNPGGGTFAALGTAFINNAGQVVFQGGTNLFLNTAGGGNSRAVGVGDAVPAPFGGSLSGSGALQAFSDAGDIVFTLGVSGSAMTNSGLFRFRSGNPLEVAAYRTQPAPGSQGGTFDVFSSISVNSTGTVSFRSSIAGGSAPFGIFQQTGSNAPVNNATDGQATILPGGGTYGLANSLLTRTLNDGSVYFNTEIPNGVADYAEFVIFGGSPSVVMSSGETLPPGARVVTRNFRVGGGPGDFVGFQTQRTGGGTSIAVHNITAHSTTIIATDGDAVPVLGGGRLRITSRNVVYVNGNGSTVFTAQMVGGSANGNAAVLVGAPGGSLGKVVVGGELDPATGRTFSNPSLNPISPIPINGAGQVVFVTNLLLGTNVIRGLYVGSVGTTPAKIVVATQMLSDGRTLQAFPVNSTFAINSTGQVAFVASTNGGGSGLYVGGPGIVPVKVAATGDAGPGGSTFSAFAVPGFNDSGEVSFVATLAGGPGGGVFVGSNSAPPVALALNGDASPAGGTFSITTARADAQINNQHDLAFRSNLTGATADSGYFIRRGPVGPLQAAVLQGQPAPGTTGGTFSTILPSPNGFIGENFQLGDVGDLAFQNFFTTAGGTGPNSIWRVKTDNTIEEILVRGTIAPEFGGGSAIISSSSLAWNSNGRFAIWARVSGGSFIDGIFLHVPGVGTNTPAGNAVPITVTDATTGTAPVAITFDSVTQAGETSLTTSSGGPVVPTAFALGDPPVFYNVETTATFSGAITLCVDFSSVSFPPGSNLRLLHFENGDWVDVTTSSSGNTICGSVASLSPFTVVQSLDTTPPALAVSLTPNVLWPANKQMVEVSASIQVSDDYDSNPQVELVSITCNETLAAGDLQGASLNTDDRSFQLRATRAGGGSGRIYTITYRARDDSGNATVRSAQVLVPHDQGQ